MSSEARGEVEAIRGGAEQQVGGGGRGVGRGAIEWRHPYTAMDLKITVYFKENVVTCNTDTHHY